VFEDDKHAVSYLEDIFSGRFVDDATVNVHSSVEIGTSQWLNFETSSGQLDSTKN